MYFISLLALAYFTSNKNPVDRSNFINKVAFNILKKKGIH